MELQIAALLIAFGAGVVIAVLIDARARRRTLITPVDAGPPTNDSRAELDDLISPLEVGVVRISERFEVVYLNRPGVRLLGGVDRRIIGRSLMETFVDHRVEEAAREARDEGSSSIEVTFRSGDERRLLLRFSRTVSAGLWLVVEDVTELRRLQRIRSEFIDNLSHELRTPLTTIRLLTETLTQELSRGDVDVPTRMRERILKIDVETTHLVQMVNELLDLSRIEGGAAELHFERVKMAEVITSATDRLRTFADRQGVRLETTLPDSALPAVWADEERLGQVMVNLLHNAIKFSPPDSVVNVSERVADGMVEVAVSDQGVGVSRADLDRIFERFYKADKARERGQGGTGLGLSIARHIVEGHGGRIWAESQEGKGSTFMFTVPVADFGDGPRLITE